MVEVADAKNRDQGTTQPVPDSAGARFPLPKRLAEQNLGVAWTVVFALGVLWILRTAEVDLRRFAMPVALMLAYVLYGWRIRRKNFTKFADSVYFLGFLWTLTALIDTLILQKYDDVLAGFGYALSATAAGMFLRMLLLQFHETVPDELEAAQEEIDAEVARLGDALARATTAATGLHRILASTSRDATDAYCAATREAGERVQAATRQVAVQLASAASEGSAETREVFRTLTGTGAALKKKAGDLESRLETISDAAERGFTSLTQSVGDAVGRLTRASNDAAASLATSLESQEWGRAIEASLARLLEVSRSVADQHERSAAAAERASTALGQLQSTAASHASGAELLNDRLTAIGRQLENLSTSATLDLAERLAAASATVAEARQAGDQLNEAVTEVLHFIRQRLEER